MATANSFPTKVVLFSTGYWLIRKVLTLVTLVIVTALFRG
jgi:hypothetical protein